MKKLVINADDFGMSQVFNEKILELLHRKLITSTSVLVDMDIEGQKLQTEELIQLRGRSNFSV